MTTTNGSSHWLISASSVGSVVKRPLQGTVYQRRPWLPELKAATAHGCWFSIGPAMFDSANGRALAAAMPRDRVVPESDGPFAKVAGKPVMPWSALRTAEDLAQLWGISPEEAAGTLARNGQALLHLMGRR